MFDVSFAANLKCSPARVRDPTVFFSLTFLHQCVADCAREWNIDGSVFVYVSDLSFPESEFFAAEPMWVDRDIRPPRNFVLQLAEVFHILISALYLMVPGKESVQLRLGC